MWKARVSIPSFEGQFTIILDGDERLSTGMGQYGPNLHQVLRCSVSWISFLADSPTDARKPNVVIWQFCKQLLSDFAGTTRVLSTLADSLLESLIVGNGGVILSSVDLYDQFRNTPVFREYMEFRRTNSPEILKFLLGFLGFSKKAGYVDPELDSIAFRKWYQVEEVLRTATSPSWIGNLKKVVAFIFEGWTFDGFLPRHGPGAVAESGVRGYGSKNLAFERHPLLDRLYGAESGLSGSPYPDHIREKSLERRMSKLMFVPKDYKSTRSICMEPVALQWSQQGIRLQYERHFAKSVLRRHVSLSDQEENQRWSCFGSLTTEVDTIDLASASDRVRWDLVKEIFPAGVLKHLYASRSNEVLCSPGISLLVSKFAPMGSALCFPVQCTIFSAVCLYIGICQRNGLDWRQPGVLNGIDFQTAYDQTFLYRKRYSRSNRHKFHPFQVYGDDIIVDNAMVSNVVSALEDLSFEVNHRKSFMGRTPVRESCGEFHFAGRDITPVRWKLDPPEANGSLRLDDIASLISLANQAYDSGYMNLRRSCINLVVYSDYVGVALKDEDKRHCFLFHPSRTGTFVFKCLVGNEHTLPRRYNKHLQRAEIRFLDVRSNSMDIRGPYHDKYLYLLWQHLHTYDEGTPELIPISALQLKMAHKVITLIPSEPSGGVIGSAPLSPTVQLVWNRL